MNTLPLALIVQLFCVSLTWDHSPSPEVTGYNLYYGVAPRTYTNHISTTYTNVITVCGLLPGVTYFFTATAFDAEGLESDQCNEVTNTPPWGFLPFPTDLTLTRTNSPGSP